MLSFPLPKAGMWGIVDVRIILLLSSSIKVYSYPIKVFSVNRMIVETAVFSFITTEQALQIKISQLNNERGGGGWRQILHVFINPICWFLNPQRLIYDDSASYALSDSNAALRAEVRHAHMPNRQESQKFLNKSLFYAHLLLLTNTFSFRIFCQIICNVPVGQFGLQR